MESFRKENTESKNSQLWLGWLDLNQRIQESKSWTLTAWRHPHHGTPHRIRTDTLQILNLLPAANWASGVLSWPYYYYYYPILAYSVSNPIHRAVEKYCHTIVVATLIVTHLRLEEGCLESKHRYLVRWGNSRLF